MRRAMLLTLLAACGTVDLPTFDAKAVARRYPSLSGRIVRAPEVPPPPAPVSAPIIEVEDPEARIGPGDEVLVNVEGEPNLREFPDVRRDFEGMTLAQARERLTQDLKKYLKRPAVRVSLRRRAAAAPGKFAYDVLGEVRQSGPLTSAIPVRLSQALSRAGGFSGDVAVNQILVIRFAGARLDVVIVCDLMSGFAKHERGEDLALADGDVVYAATLDGPSWDAIADAAGGRCDRAGLIRALAAR